MSGIEPFVDNVPDRGSQRFLAALRIRNGSREYRKNLFHLGPYERLIVVHTKRVEVGDGELPQQRQCLALESGNRIRAARCAG